MRTHWTTVTSAVRKALCGMNMGHAWRTNPNRAYSVSTRMCKACGRLEIADETHCKWVLIQARSELDEIRKYLIDTTFTYSALSIPFSEKRLAVDIVAKLPSPLTWESFNAVLQSNVPYFSHITYADTLALRQVFDALQDQKVLKLTSI